MGEVESFDSNEERVFVNRLKEGEDRAWEEVFQDIVVPVTRSERYGPMMRDFRLSENEVFGMFYETMIVKKKIDNYKYRSPFIYWAKTYVIGEITHFAKKNPHPVSVEDDSDVYTTGRTSSRTRAEDWEIVQKCFAELWRENPARAYVHLLRTRANMPAQKVMELLGISSKDNVDKIFSRAVDRMRELRNNLCGEKK